MSLLLQPSDPQPVESIEASGESRLLLVCEHAGRAIPRALGDLGLSAAQHQSHIGWDIGAADLTRELAHRTGAGAVMQRYSRLVIDCNRPPQASDAMPANSHGVLVAANQQLGDADRNKRIEEIFAPFDAELARRLGTQPRFQATAGASTQTHGAAPEPACTTAFAIHSFTALDGRQSRPWDIGFLFRRNSDTSTMLAELLGKAQPQLLIGMNEPYAVDDESDWFVPQYGERLGLHHSLLEIRNDHLQTTAGQRWWAEVLSTLFRQFLESI